MTQQTACYSYGRSKKMHVLALPVPAAVRQRVPAEVILRVGCDSFGITHHELISRSREREIAEARALVAHLLYSHTTLTERRIGQLLGRRHQATISSAISAAERLIAGPWRSDYEAAVRRLETGISPTVEVLP